MAARSAGNNRKPPSPAMKPRWKAKVEFLSPYRHEAETIHYGLFEADTDWVAARKVTQWAAQYRYQQVGDVGLLTMTDKNEFRGAIGYRTKKRPTILVGGTIVIHLTPEQEG